MKHQLRFFLMKIERTIVFLMKGCMYLALLGAFFGIMSIEHWQLLRLSRTAGITLFTFVVMILAMTNAYGGYDIGKRKSRPIISSLGIAITFTDLVTYIALMIMNTNAAQNNQFQLESIGLFAITFAVHLAIIFLFVYAGNYIFFRIVPPQRCCIVTSSASSFIQINKAVSPFKLQYDIRHVRDYKSRDLFDVILKCDSVFIYDVPVKERTEIIEYCYRNMRNIYFSPEIADIVEISARHVIIDDISLINLPMKELSLEQKIMKRAMDIVLSMIALIISSPIFIICALAIKLDDGGSIFFKQKRATKDGQVFEVYKFRTMKENVANYSATSDDDRITRAGKFLRKYRLDEFPQFINILKGDMSFVGPRPEMLENVYQYTKEYPEFAYRLRVKAGLTGYAQIAGKYNTSPKYKLILDLLYIENYSIMKDLKLILQTLIVLLKPDSTEAFGTEAVKDIENVVEVIRKNWPEEYEAYYSKLLEE